MDDMKRTSEYRRMLPFIAKASNDVGDDTQGQEVQALLLALNNHKTSTDHDGRYYTEGETDTLLGGKADKSLTFTAGNGLTGGGDLSADRTFAVGAGTGITVNADDVAINLAANLTWTGGHTFSGSLTTGSIMPALSDVYDLGDYTKPWRKIWGSELSAVIFSQYEQVLLGGWLTISKGEGKLAGAIGATDNYNLDLGGSEHAYANGDILVFRGISSDGSPQVEYMRIDSWLGGSLYGVTRNLDGTSHNAWPKGTVFANWGQVGNGRVELNAYDEPRLSVYSHGAAIADFREQVRIGDLNGGWGYSSSVFGGAFGAYETGKANITIDPTNGIRIRNYDQDVIKLTGTTASFENFITLGLNGGIRQGTGTWGSSFTGTAMWAETVGSDLLMNVGGWNTGVKQWWGGSDGKLYTGAGAISLEEGGIRIKDVFGLTDTITSIRFESCTDLDPTTPSTNYIGWLKGTAWGTIDSYDNIIALVASPIAGGGGPTNNAERSQQIHIYSMSYSDVGYAEINLQALNYGSGKSAAIWVQALQDNAYIQYSAANGHLFSGPVCVYNGIKAKVDGTGSITYTASGGHNITGNLGVNETAKSGYGIVARGPGSTLHTYGLVLRNTNGTNTFWVNDAGNAWLSGTLTGTWADSLFKPSNPQIVALTSLTYIHNGAMTAGQTINANVTSYGVPAGARFVLVSAQGQWAGTTGSLVVGKYGTTENDLICRPQVANLPNNNNGTVRVVSNLIRIQNNNLAGTIAVAIVGYAM